MIRPIKAKLFLGMMVHVSVLYKTEIFEFLKDREQDNKVIAGIKLSNKVERSVFLI